MLEEETESLGRGSTDEVVSVSFMWQTNLLTRDGDLFLLFRVTNVYRVAFLV